MVARITGSTLSRQMSLKNSTTGSVLTRRTNSKTDCVGLFTTEHDKWEKGYVLWHINFQQYIVMIWLCDVSF